MQRPHHVTPGWLMEEEMSKQEMLPGMINTVTRHYCSLKTLRSRS